MTTVFIAHPKIWETILGKTCTATCVMSNICCSQGSEKGEGGYLGLAGMLLLRLARFAGFLQLPAALCSVPEQKFTCNKADPAMIGRDRVCNVGMQRRLVMH